MHDICNYDTYFIQKYDVAGVLGLLLEQKLTAVIRMMAYGSSANQVDEIARMRKSITLESLVKFYDTIETFYTRDYLRKPTPRNLQRLLQKAEAQGFFKHDWKHRLGLACLFGVAESQNELNVLGQSPIFNNVLRSEALNISYEINNTVYWNGYYLADDIYSRWTTFVKSIPHPRCEKEKLFSVYQEGYRKDVERVSPNSFSLSPSLITRRNPFQPRRVVYSAPPSSAIAAVCDSVCDCRIAY
ncbi:hypothetical protein L3X38_006653 [Prunus dulcis]|uniref:Uncharacterized protein n=1 Tax=Prunus dulcis TaxID=3755 RepID=A0AAD4ZTA0_PRUDU|nr:hypothetical protein L3X38_006653 [Prunus dulcis]